MKKYEYAISRHPVEAFRRLTYFCSADGQCGLDEVPADQTEALEAILNERGENGWDLIQLVFGKNGILGFWKREMTRVERTVERGFHDHA